MVDVEGCQDGQSKYQSGGQDVEPALCRERLLDKVKLHRSIA